MTASAKPYLTHIFQALTAIESYRPATQADLLEQPMAWDAILMRLQDIGENLAQIRHLDEEVFAAIADPSWYKVIGLRNVISHGYHRIEPDILWETITVDLPAFRQTLHLFDNE